MVASIINMHEAKTHLSRLVERALAGEEIWIARAGKRLVKLTPEESAQPRRRDLYGILKGRITLPDDFDDPLPDEVLEAFYGGPPPPTIEEESGSS